ncbi:TolB family protein [Microbacterium sp.]|uniref:TolB family protein n=1 Tax=Microbacterium sp. TaxID=51671 RepID=UPI0035B1F6F5
MSIHDDRLTSREHDDMRDLVLAGTQSIPQARSTRAPFVAGAVALLLIGGLTGGILTATLREDGTTVPIATPSPSPESDAPASPIVYSSGFFEGDIYVVNPGSAPRRIIGSDVDALDQICPAFSPDGTRLASGQAAGDGQSGWQSAALVISDLDADGEPAGSVQIPLDGVGQPPCPIWSPDGQWVAFGGGTTHAQLPASFDQVWLVHVDSGSARVINVNTTDIEWSADSTGLYVAGDSLRRYEIGEADLGPRIPGTQGAVALTASPDGTSLAFERQQPGSVERFDLVLMGTDGSDQRILAEGYTRARGIGPVWSPDGERIVFQRTCTRNCADLSTELRQDEIVILSVAEDDPLGPMGTQTVLAPTQTTEGSEPRLWIPVTVSWAPDSSTLRFIGWELRPSGEMASGSGLLTVPVDGAAAPAVLWETPEGIGAYSAIPQNDFQTWRTR